jgi:hypothetical protein
MNFNYFLYGFIVLVSFSCAEKESFDDVDIAVHAVSGLYNPQSFFIDNTIEGMHYALKFEELDGIEVDVQYSSDGSLWMFHDQFLEDRTSESGRICEKTDDLLSQVTYADANDTKISKLSTINWLLNVGDKNIYVDLKNLKSCNSSIYSPTDFISELNKINQNEGLTTFPIINDTAFALVVHNAGFKVFSDAFSYAEANEKLTSFYYGVFIRNSDLTGSEVSNLQINGKKVILFDMFSLTGVKEGLKKHPNALLVEDFKSAIIERN